MKFVASAARSLLCDHKVQVEDTNRWIACTDIRTFVTLVAAWQAMGVLYGSNRKLRASHVFNFDASTGRTFKVDASIKDVKGAPAKEGSEGWGQDFRKRTMPDLVASRWPY